jgi:hypothetical protein
MTEHLTVGDLRAKIRDLPDNMPVVRVDDHDDGHAIGHLHFDVVKEVRPGRFNTYPTPEEFAEQCDADGVLLPDAQFREQDRPPEDGVLALTLWP